jgi:hypothetical protein
MITRSRQSTIQTKMPPIGERLADFCATDARLRSASGIHSNKHAPGAFSLVRDHVQELSPACIIDRLREHPRSQAFYIQILDRDQSVFVDQLPRFFVVKVRALTADVSVYALKNLHGLTPPVRAFCATAYTPLRDPQAGSPRAVVARILNRSAVAQSRQRSQSNVHADCVRVEGQRLRLNFASQDRKPSACFTFDGQRLDRAFDWSVEFDSDVADLRDAELVTGQSVADLSEGHGVITTNRLETRIARLLLYLHATKERLKGQINTLQDIFKGVGVYFGYVRANGFDFCKLTCLRFIPNRLAFYPPSIAPFLKSGIVKLAADCQLPVERLCLPLAWIDSVSVNSKGHVANARFVSETVRLDSVFSHRFGPSSF